MEVDTINLAIVDDDPLVVAGLRMMLRSAPEIRVVGEMYDGSQIVPFLYDNKVDVVIMDVRMPQVNGISATRSVKRRFPDIRVVLMSTIPAEMVTVHTKNVGADTFINKTADMAEFRDAIIGHSVSTTSHDLVFQPRARLSRREFEVAQMVANGATNEEIAQEDNLSINTVKTYVSRSLRKLNLNNRVQLANYIHEYRQGAESGRK